MHILILGAAGMVGRKLTERLLRDGRLGTHDITRMTLQDVVAPTKPANASIPITVVASDFADAGAAAPTDRPPAGGDLPSRRDRLGRGRS